jgi:hypothetical protein
MSYEMPKAEVGEIVLFQTHEGSPHVPAIVCKASARTLTLYAMSGESGVTIKPSVHHVTDEGVNEFPEWKKYGFWEHRPKDPRISLLSERISLLEKKLEALDPKKAK